MRRLPTPDRRPRLALILLAAVLLAGLAGSPASADTLQSAQARAAALRAQLNSLQARADRAVEQYDLAEGQLGQAVTRRLSLDAALQDARQSGGAQQAAQDARIRALYMSGGAPALYATVLASGNLADALDRIRSVQSVLSADRSGLAATDARARRLATAETQAQTAAEQQTRLTAHTQALADQVQGLIAEQQSLIANADAQVLAFEQAQEAAAQRASQQAFAAQLAAAQAQALASGALSLPAGVGAPSATLAIVLAAAEAQLGKPYVWGAVGPNAFDCSGFTGYAYAAAGIALPRTAAQQYQAGPHPSLAELQPGDLLFWASDPTDWRTIDHEAMYVGDGEMIVAPKTGDVVKIQKVYAQGYFGATRVDPAISGSVPGPQWAGFTAVRR